MLSKYYSHQTRKMDEFLDFAFFTLCLLMLDSGYSLSTVKVLELVRFFYN